MRRVIVCLIMPALAACHLTGCATMERWTDEHPQVVPVGSLVLLSVGGVVLAKGIAKSGRTQVVQQPRTQLGPL